MTDFKDYLTKSFGLEPSTAVIYASKIKIFFETVNKPPDQITIQDLIYFFQELYDKGYAQSTQVTYLSAIRAYYDYLAQIGELDTNIARMFKRRFRVPKKLPEVITIEEVDKMINEPFNHRYEERTAMLESAIIATLGSTGIRRGELCSLKPENLDEDSRTLRVVGKRNKERVVPIVKRWFSSDPLEKVIWLLEEGIGEVYPKKVERVVKKYGLIVCRKNVHPHTLRHTFATQLIKDKVDLNVVKNILGHDSIITTEKYVHLAHKDLMEELKSKGII